MEILCYEIMMGFYTKLSSSSLIFCKISSCLDILLAKKQIDISYTMGLKNITETELKKNV